jgi:hypothetical protein
VLSRKQERKTGNKKQENGSSHLHGSITFSCSQSSCMVVHTYRNEERSNPFAINEPRENPNPILSLPSGDIKTSKGTHRQG